MAATGSSRRIEILAKPKSLHPKHTFDRRSVYWIDRRPLKPQSGGTTVFIVTARVEQLSQPRRKHEHYQEDRPTSEWEVPRAALSAEASPRVVDLSQHKNPHPEFVPERDVYTKVRSEAMSAHPSGRIVQLSEPKPHKIWHNSQDTYRDPDFSRPITVISPIALKARSTARVEELANPKHLHQQYEHERSVQWPVSENAKNATATSRLQQLARPKSARLRTDDYNPYKVSNGAKGARATPRVAELSEPLARKQRNKKI